MRDARQNFGAFGAKNFERYPACFAGDQLVDWLRHLPTSTDSAGNRVVQDHDGAVLLICGEALRYASRQATARAAYPEYSQHMRKGCGIPSSQVLVERLARGSFSGSIVNRTGEQVHLNYNLQHMVELATVCTGEKLRWSNNYAASIVPFATPEGGVAVPLVGGFWWRGSDLTTLQHARFPITAAHEADGQKATIPVYSQGGRSILIPVDTFMHYRRLPSGGLELPTEPVFNEHEYIKQRVIAFQYVGAGHPGYIRHFFIPPGPLANGQAYYSINGLEARSVTDPSYWATKGIILDQRYQHDTTAPTGAMVNCEAVVSMERKLLANGALIGAVTVGFVPLISKAELDHLVGCQSGAPFDGHIQVQVKAVVDSTNRLDSLLCYGSEAITQGRDPTPDDPMHLVFANQLKLTAEAYFGTRDDSQELYLSRLGEVMGTNFRAAVLSGLTIPWNGRAAENLSLTGMLCDVENCEECAEPYHFASMALKWIDILVSLSRTSYLDIDLSLTKMLESFWRAAMPRGDTFSSDMHILRRLRGELVRSGEDESTINKIVAWHAAARITGLVVADVFSEQYPNLRIPEGNIRTTFEAYHALLAISGSSGEFNQFLQHATRPENWPTIAPRYYQSLASLAIAQFYDGKEPQIP